MDAETLRAKQKPLKDRYKEDPAAARVTSVASGRVRGDDVAIDVAGWNGTITAGLHPSTGGDGSQACSADVLLRALVSCTGVTLKSVATAMGVELRDAEIAAEGDWDARGTLGMSKDTPVGITAIRLKVRLDTDADDKTQAKLLELTERFCVIYQTLKTPPTLTLERS